MSNSPVKRDVPPLEEWSVQEKLLLASAVAKNGDQNWASVSRTIKPYGRKHRPSEWYSQQNCARQYNALLNKMERPKRKRGETESAVETIINKLKDERIKELRGLIAEGRDKYVTMIKEISEANGNMESIDFSDNLSSDSDTESDISELSYTSMSCDTKKGGNGSVDQGSDHLKSDKVKELDCHEINIVSTCVANVPDGDSSLLEKLSSGLPSTPRKKISAGPNVSPQLKNLVHTAIAGASEDERPKNMSASVGAPTLSLLLEMPPRDRGQPLPEIPTPVENKSSKNQTVVIPESVGDSNVILPESDTLKLANDVADEEPKNKPGTTTGKSTAAPSETFEADSQNEVISISTVLTSSESAEHVEIKSEVEEKGPKELTCTKVSSSNITKESGTKNEEIENIADSVNVIKFEDDISKLENIEETKMDKDTVSGSTNSSTKAVEANNVGKHEDENVEDISKKDNNKKVCTASVSVPKRTTESAETPVIVELNVPPMSRKRAAVNSSSQKKMLEDCPTVKLSNRIDEVKTLSKNDRSVIQGLSEKSDKIPVESENVIGETMTEKQADTTTLPSSVVVNKSDNGHSETKVVDAKTGSLDNGEQQVTVSDSKDKEEIITTVAVKIEQDEKLESKILEDDSKKSTNDLYETTDLKNKDLTNPISCDAESKDTPPTGTSQEEIKDSEITESKSELHVEDTCKTPSAPLQIKETTIEMGKKRKAGNSDIGSPPSVLRNRRGSTSSSSTKNKPENQISDHKNVISDEVDKTRAQNNETDNEVEVLVVTPKKSVEVEATKSKSEKSTKGSPSVSDVLPIESELSKNPIESKTKVDKSSTPRNANSKRGVSERKEKHEIADLSDDDVSNSAVDTTSTKKRITRRSFSVKVVHKQSDPEFAQQATQEIKTSQQKDRLSLPISSKNSKPEAKRGRPTKAVARVQNLNEEASMIYGDLESQITDGSASRVTRARTSSTPSKNATILPKPEKSNDMEKKTGTIGRRSSVVGTPDVDHLPSVTIDSNPSSPSSSTTNSTILDEDKDQRGFRKSIMLVWNRIAAHKFSSLFLKPIGEVQAPGYLKKVIRPIDLATIKKNVEMGLTRQLATFERDVYLMFMNAVMFNPTDHEISLMCVEMERDVRIILEEHSRMLKISLERDGSGPICEKNLQNYFESDLESVIEEDKNAKVATPSSSASAKKRREEPKEDETPASKKRKGRSTAATTGSSKKVKPLVSPDIVSA